MRVRLAEAGVREDDGSADTGSTPSRWTGCAGSRTIRDTDRESLCARTSFRRGGGCGFIENAATLT